MPAFVTKQARVWLCALLVATMGLWLPAGGARAQGGDVAYLLAGVNGARAANGLAPYSLNPLLTAAAQAHSEDMGAQAALLLGQGSDISGAITHTGSDGSSATSRVLATGYPAIQVGENIYATRSGPQTALDWWLASAAHTNNILHANYREIGIGAAPGPEGLTMYTLVFAYSADSPALPAPAPPPTAIPPTAAPTEPPTATTFVTATLEATATPAPTSTTAHVSLPRPVTLTPSATPTEAGPGGGMFAVGNETRVILPGLAAVAAVGFVFYRLLARLARKLSTEKRED